MDRTLDPRWTWALALALAALFTVVFAFGFQAAFYGDAPLQLLSYRRGLPTGHRLHFYLTEGFAGLGLSPLGAIRAASFVPAGLAIGCLFAALIRAGLAWFPALLGTLLFAATPSVLFFSTSVEVHGLQLLGVSLAFFAALQIGHPSATSGMLGLLGWSALAAVALATTHPMNLAAGLGLGALFLVGLRARGASRTKTLAVGAAAGALLLFAALLASYGYLDRQGWSLAVLLESFRWRFETTLPGSDRPVLLHNFLEAVALPAALLLALGLLGLVLEALRPSVSRGLPLALLLWVLGPVLLLLGPDFHERGAYFLVALPPLALGVACLAARGRGLALLAALAILAQGGLAVSEVRAWDRPPPPEAEEWLAGLKLLSGGRGVLLAEDAQQQDWARRYLGMPTDNLRLFLVLPEAELLAFAHTFTDWARAMANDGEPLWLPSRVLDLAPEIPPLQRATEVLEESFRFQAVTARGFQGYKGS